MAKKMTARPVRLNCPKCLAVFTVVAYISQGVDRESFYQQRAADHDCEDHARKLATVGTALKNPLKASKAAAKRK